MRYEIRALSLGEILDTAFRLVRDHAVLLIGISLAVTIPVQIFTKMFANAAASGSLAFLAAFAGLMLFMIVVSPIVSAAITYAISEVYLGRTATLGASLSVGLKLLVKLVGTAVLMMLIIIPATLLLVIPGVYLVFAYILVHQVIVIEGTAGWTALQRSFELTRQNMLRAVGIYLVSGVVMSIVGFVLGFLSAQIPYAELLVDAIVQGVMTAYMSAAFVVLYFDIRCRKEAFDLEHLAERVGGGEPQALPAA